MRSVVRFSTAIAILSTLLSPLVVSGQTGAAPPAAKTAPGWVFTPSVGVGGAWDDNVLLVNPGSNPPADYGYPITPGASLDYTGKLTKFSSGYNGSFVRYVTLENLNSFQHSFRAMAERRANARLTFFGQENLTIAPTTDVLQLGGVPFYRIGSQSNMAGGGTQIALAKHTTLKSVYTLNSVTFDDSLVVGSQLQGGHSHAIATSVNQAVSSHLVIGGEYQFTRAVVNGRPVAGVPVEDDRFNLQTGSFTAQYQAAPGTTLSGAIGIARIGAGLAHAEQTGPEWRGALLQRAGRGLVSVGYERSHIPSFGFGGTFQNEEWTANVHMPIGRSRFYVDGGFAWLSNEPLDAIQPSLKTAWLSGNAGYYATRWLTVEGFYGRTQQDSQLAGGQLQRNQIGFRVSAAKPMKLR